MCVAEPVHLDVHVELGGGERGLQNRITEPATRDVSDRVPTPGLTWLVLALAPSLGPVVRVCPLAVPASAFASAVAAEGSMPVLPAGIVRLGEPQVAPFDR